MKYDIDHEFVSISSQTATHRIILIHGWGADADDLLTIGKEITEKTNLDFELISLRAPGLHPSGQGRQWYGLYPHDWKGAEAEVNKLLDTLKEFDTEQISLRKTVLLGFSQGAAMAIDAGFKLNLGLIVSCSGYPHPTWVPGEKCPPLIVSHGLFDDVVPIDASRIIYEKVKSKSSKFCELLEFDGFHQIDSNLINFLSSNMSNIL
ncbi:alpha/beta hydrolase [Prochlorococcus marinus]|uniref:alpha/beta hydrolase n=1 Tax=Prochlorococcus marinus TaxID=1219 RepID=UPI001ADAECCE|nr:esterase [Prochlorococcus marinus]MBO8203838.1 esterase [Prochlorococcus marinus CUG1415]MBW3043142.1 esterase [Prochlorococcus marinus str. MU1415]